MCGGGELLLTGGVVLASTDAAAQRRYVRELAARGVPGVAIETGSELRQTLYQRLHRIFDTLGGDPRGSSRVAALHLAARLHVGGLSADLTGVEAFA